MTGKWGMKIWWKFRDRVVIVVLATMIAFTTGLVACNVAKKKSPSGETTNAAVSTRSTAEKYPFFGEWKITKTIGHPLAPPTLLGAGKPTGPSLIGTEITCGAREILSPFGNVENPIYQLAKWNADDFHNGFRLLSPDQLGSPEYVDINSMTVVPLIRYSDPNGINSKEPDWINPGNFLIIVDHDTMITIWNVDAFLMKRVGK